jgi:putative ABC transport system ATP-binding protein
MSISLHQIEIPHSFPVALSGHISYRLKIDHLVLDQKAILIEGPSGSGKSTLLNVITGLHRPQKGQVFIFGQDLTALSTTQCDQFRGQVFGFVLQTAYFIPSLNVRENLHLAFSALKNKPSLAEQKNRIAHLLSETKLDHLAQKPVQFLSVGEAQRLSLVRALLHKPAILVADEPSSALDDENCSVLLKLLTNPASLYGADYQPHLLVASHDQRLKDYFVHKISLAKGELVSS